MTPSSFPADDVVAPAAAEYGLAIHSSTGELGLALMAGKTLAHQQTWPLQRQLLNQLPLCLQAFLPHSRWSELAYLVVAQGPGSFTSIRIGMVAARILAQQLNIPLFAVSSLQGFAQSLLPLQPAGLPIAVVMKATRGYVYGAIYQEQEGQLKPVIGDRLWLPTEWEAHLHTQGLTATETPDDLGYTASAILDIAAQRWQTGERPHWAAAEPFYGMSPTDPQ